MLPDSRSVAGRSLPLRVLWVTTEPPDRNLGGGSIRQAHLLEALARRAAVTLLLYGSTLNDDTTRAALTGLIEIPGNATEPVRRPMGRRMHDLRDALVEEHPPEVSNYRRVRATLARQWQQLGSFDVVLIEHPGLAPLVGLRKDEHWLLTLHNVGSGTLDQQADTVTGRRRWIYRRQARQARNFERWALDAFEVVFSVSDDDARLLPVDTTVIPNGVDVDRFTFTPVPAEPRLALIGTLGYLPNVDGATWLVREVLPLIRREVPDVSLDLVGRMPTPEVLDLAQVHGVAVHADVPDVREYFLRARVCLVPLRVGTGTRLKALEAFAAYRPVVGTTVGLSGLGVVDGTHAFVADDAAGFASRVITLLRNDEVVETLVTESRRLVEQHFSWREIGHAFTDAVLSVRS